nr:lipase 3-like [Onthophagus taurus]
MIAITLIILFAPHILSLESVSYSDQELPKTQHPDVGLNVLELIEKYNYPVERHRDIQTDDGYLLEIHRIPYGLKNGPAENKPVIFLMHGLLSSSADWINMGPEKSLGFLLADMGYDVWMGNARGNTWSRKHVSLNPDGFFDQRKFWAFSWNEIGMYDLPAMIDYILEVTNQNSLYYIGHSQGTTSFFVMGSERPEYNKKIRLMVALAPVAYMSHATNPFLQVLSPLEGVLEVLAGLIGIYEFMPSQQGLETIGSIFCRDGAIFQEMCAGIIFLIGGFDSQQLNRTLIPVMMSNTPAGASVKQFVHYAQGVTTFQFRKYDFGLVENLVKYGSRKPPSYGLNNIEAPVALFYGKNDWLASVVDVEKLAKKLPNVVKQYLVPFDKFNHLDFLWAIDVVPLLYESVFDLLAQY